jgi:glucosamine--fructose-6-phosphate aminotransferase (isomerizing)
MGLHDEILEQPLVFERFLETQLPHIEQIAAEIRERQVDYVLLAARGTSDNAGIYAQYAWGVQNGLPVALAAPSQFSVYHARLRLEHALVVAISQSGQSPDVVTVVEEGRRQGAMTLALTNEPASPLAQAANFTIDLQAGIEKAVAATKTYTAELLAIAALSAALAGDHAGLASLRRLPDMLRQALAQDEHIREVARSQAAMTHCVVLGRGYNYATAKEWGLKLKELAYVMADAYSTADFQHGPLALVEPGFPVLAVLSHGAVFDETLELLRTLRDGYGAKLLVISDSPQAQSLAAAALPVPADLPEWLTPLVNIVPAQLYCYHLTLAKGYNAETPRSIHKVTLTR